MDYAAARTRLVDWLRRQLIGPASEKNGLGMSPLGRYPTGVLYPIVPGESGIDPGYGEEEEENDVLLGTDTESDDRTLVQPVKRRRYIPPSSVGFSFFVRGKVPRLEVTPSAARYCRNDERDEKGQYQSAEYERIPLGGDEQTFTITSGGEIPIWPCPDRQGEYLAGIDVRKRRFLDDGWIITISLFNRQKWEPGQRASDLNKNRAEKALFEAKLFCLVDKGELVEYPRIDPNLLSDEDRELELQYSDKHIYAVGHGAAVNWRVMSGAKPELWSEFMPAVEVPQVTADVSEERKDSRILGFDYLAAPETQDGVLQENVLTELEHFADGYANWVAREHESAAGFGGGERTTAERICGRMSIALERMRRGIALLRTDPAAAQSFRLANRAMLDQMRQYDRIQRKTVESTLYRWRPFQLAFLLTVMESVVREGDDFRDVLDLIWFPTGGGKTEAYLGLIAFLIVWRRLKYPDSGSGTVVLMRYTLRLLTAQQYQRAARIVCALELLRREKQESLGKDPITAGIWVGAALSPNTIKQALEYVQEIAKGKSSAPKKLMLDACPWCDTCFQAPDSYHATRDAFHFLCINPECEFGGNDSAPLPCVVVDEALYHYPPSLLIGTIDKFAHLAWEERANAFFGSGRNRPPELVIQDELHLIAGPLGSVAGLYEAALDTILTHDGVRPKYIASTATIRMAKQQVERLYGRDLVIFPPPGLSSDDSYFARAVPLDQRRGRLYVGYLAPMLDRQHCLAPLAAALLVGPSAEFKDGEIDRDDLLDAWSTQVIYHGSMEGVNNSHNAFNIDVPDFSKRLLEEIKKEKENKEEDADIRNLSIDQLTSRTSAEGNAKVFARLEKSRNEEGHLDAVLATNMISVGLDVARLALMVINGQPLTTADYIQASSRVGRDQAPGLVFANYYRSQARSLSHYENFRPYHETFYRFVEPTSVTPYTYQARSRALHAALVIVVRHVCGKLRENKSAGNFNRDDREVKDVIDRLKLRCEKAAPDLAGEVDAHLDRLVEQWHDEAYNCSANKRKLIYKIYGKEKNADSLLCSYDDDNKSLWPTLQSMRNVENTVVLKIRVKSND